MVNIAILSWRFTPALISGAEIQAEGWARHLGAAHRVTAVVLRDPAHLPLREERDGYDVVRISTPVPAPARIPRPLVPGFLRGRGLSRPFRRVEDNFRLWVASRGVVLCGRDIDPKPDVLLCFMTHATGLVGVEVGRRLGIPAVIWMRSEADYQLSDSVYRRPLAGFWQAAAGVLVQSEVAGAKLLAELARVSPESVPVVRDKLAVVENGVDLPMPSAYHRDGPVLSVGRLVATKGMDVVIEACAQLGRALVIAGDGPESDALRAQAAALGAQVRFTGNLERDALDDLYRSASVVVLASHTEGLPNVVLEAMAHARPVVATPVGSIPDVIDDGVNGLLVPPGDPGALASAIKRLVADPELAERLGLAARATAEQFAWDRVIPKLEDALGRWGRR